MVAAKRRRLTRLRTNPVDAGPAPKGAMRPLPHAVETRTMDR